VALFSFASPVLKSGDPHNAVGLRQGILRILLLLLHDFPEFLSENYFQICEAIPSNCVQMRNIVLSAFPGTILLPDPHPAGQLDALKEASQAPTIGSDYRSNLKAIDLQALDQQLLGRGSPSILNQLVESLLLPPNDSGERYNLSVMNAMVLYTGVSTAARAFSRNEIGAFSPNDPGVVLIQYIASSLDLEGTPFYCLLMDDCLTTSEANTTSLAPSCSICASQAATLSGSARCSSIYSFKSKMKPLKK
jgi:CCR4-NOT transcription complex subunit 1